MSERVARGVEAQTASQQLNKDDDEHEVRRAPSSRGGGLIPAMYGPSTVPYGEELQPLMPNVELSTVTAHVGGAPASAAKDIGANAFTAGDQIVLPDSPSKRTVAHELVHVAQQRNGVSLPDGQGTKGDAHEQQADAMAEQVVAGKSVDIAAPSRASGPAAIQMESAPEAEEEPRYGEGTEKQYGEYRNETKSQWAGARQQAKDPKPNDPFAAGRDDAKAIEGKKVGQGGFGARLIGGASRMAQADAKSWGTLAAPVQPVTEPLDKQYAEQQEHLKKTHSKDHLTHITGDTAMMQKKLAYSREWTVENLATIDRHRFEQARWIGAYNGWRPLANASHVALAEMMSAAKLMGFDPRSGEDMAAFVEAIEASLGMANQLVDAKVLGNNNDQSWSSRNDDPTAVTHKARPELGGEQLGPKLDGVKDAYNELRVAHHGVYLGLLDDQKAMLQAKAGQVSAEIAQLNQVIAFWTGATGFVSKAGGYAKDAAIGATGDAIARKTRPDGSRHGKKAAKDALDHAHKSSKDPNDYKHDIESHARVDDYETYHDTWGQAGQEKLDKERRLRGEPEPAPPPPVAFPDLSAQGALQFGLKLLTEDKLDALNQQLLNIQGQIDAKDRAKAFVQTTAAQDAYRKAVARMKDEIKKVEHASLRDREQEMVKFGHELDAYAVENKSDLHKRHADGLAPGPGKEIYATAMASVAKIEKYRALSKLSLHTFPYDQFVETIHVLARERAGIVMPRESESRTYDQAMKAPPSLRPMTPSEDELYQQIAGTYLIAMQRDAQWDMRLEGVIERFRALMVKVTGSGGVEGTVGKGF